MVQASSVFATAVYNGLAHEDVGQLLHVGPGDDGLTFFALLAQAVDELSPQDVDLAVQDAAPI